MSTENKELETLKAQLEESSTKVSDLEAKFKAAEVERDSWKDKVEATEKEALIKTVHDLEGRMGKTEKELTDLSASSLEDVKTKELEAQRAFSENPPKPKPRVPTHQPPKDASGNPNPRKGLFARRVPVGSTTDGGGN